MTSTTSANTISALREMFGISLVSKLENYVVLYPQSLQFVPCMVYKSYKLLDISIICAVGAFVVRTTERDWHSVGVDVAHEMLINKSCKTSVIHPSRDYIGRIANYLPYRTICNLGNNKEVAMPVQNPLLSSAFD